MQTTPSEVSKKGSAPRQIGDASEDAVNPSEQSSAPENSASSTSALSGQNLPILVAIGAALAVMLAAGVIMLPPLFGAIADDNARHSAASSNEQSASEYITPAPTPSDGASPESTPSSGATSSAEVPLTGTIESKLKKGANVRSKPSSKSSRVGGLDEHQRVQIECFAIGEKITDKQGTTDKWYKIAGGYISAAIVKVEGTGSAQEC